MGTLSRFAIVSFGVRVGIEVRTLALVNPIVDCLPAGWKRTSGRALDRRYSITTTGTGQVELTLREFTGGDEVCVPWLRGGEVAISSLPAARSSSRGIRLEFNSMDQFLRAFESDLHLYVAARARGRLFVHAGVVGWHHAAIVIPGRSFSGKSRLVAALMQAGATAYSDEYAIFDSSGRVHAFPRPLRLRADGRTRARRIPLPGDVHRAPLKNVLLVLSRYKEGASWIPRRIPPGAATLHLLANTVAVRRCPQRALSVLSRVAGHAVAFESHRGEAQHIAESLLELCHTSFPASTE